MNRFAIVLLALMLLIVCCIPFAFASSGTETESTESEPVESESIDSSTNTGDSVIPDTDLEGSVDQETFMDELGNYFGVIAVPTEVMKVFEGFVDIWQAIPIVIRYTFILCFTLACTFAIFKMLF